MENGTQANQSMKKNDDNGRYMYYNSKVGRCIRIFNLKR